MKLRSKKEKSQQAKVIIAEHEGPDSPKKLKNLHEISFLSDSQEENTNDLLPTKESNPGHFTLPYTISNFNFYAIADLGASVNVEDSVWSKRYSEWCNENSHDKKPRPRDYTFKEWVKLKKGHLDISSIPINRGLIQASLTALPPQLIGEATKASNLQRIPPRVQGRSHFTYFLYLIIFLDYRVTLGFGSTGGLDLACPTIRLSLQYGIHQAMCGTAMKLLDSLTRSLPQWTPGTSWWQTLTAKRSLTPDSSGPPSIKIAHEFVKNL
ncbi:hypothetical protein Tco_1403271 [Tanacetum coccineum]